MTDSLRDRSYGDSRPLAFSVDRLVETRAVLARYPHSTRRPDRRADECTAVRRQRHRLVCGTCRFTNRDVVLKITFPQADRSTRKRGFTDGRSHVRCRCRSCRKRYSYGLRSRETRFERAHLTGLPPQCAAHCATDAPASRNADTFPDVRAPPVPCFFFKQCHAHYRIMIFDVCKKTLNSIYNR